MQSFLANVTEIGARFQEFVETVFPPGDDDDDNNGGGHGPRQQHQLVPAYALARRPGLAVNPVDPSQIPRFWGITPNKKDDPLVLTAMQMRAQQARAGSAVAYDIQPQRVAAALTALTSRIQPNALALDRLVKEARDLGSNVHLNALWQSPVLNEILDRGRSCHNFDEVLSQFYDRKLDLVGQLSWMNRLRYGPTIKSLVDKLIAHKSVLQGISDRYALLTGLTQGEGAVDILCYFFRPDRLRPQAREILESYAESLKTLAHPLPWPPLRLTQRS